MFDVDTFNLAEAVQESPDYKLIKIGGWLYVFPADTDFSPLQHNRYSDALERHAVLSISPSGAVQRNRFGQTTTNTSI